MKKLFSLMLCLASTLLISCGQQSEPAAKKEPPKPPEAVTGQSALYKMFQKARTWSADAKVLKLNSIHLADVPAEPGKSGAWQATFTSDTLGKTATYTYSVAEEQGNLHQGTFALQQESWSGHQGVNTAFDIRAASTDSDAAYKAALEKSEDYAKKNPGMPISFQLEQITKFPQPVWRVIWGESVGTSNYSVYVDASTGKYLEKMH